jgi:hypothetical protein
MTRTSSHPPPAVAGRILPTLRRLLQRVPATPSDTALGTAAPAGSRDQPGYAILVQYLAGDHEYWKWHADSRTARRLHRRYVNYFRGWGIARMTVVLITRDQCRQHAEYSRCRAGNCPGIAEASQ